MLPNISSATFSVTADQIWMTLLLRSPLVMAPSRYCCCTASTCFSASRTTVYLLAGMTMSSRPTERPAARRVLEAELLDAIEHFDRDLETEVQVAVVDQLADALLLEQAVDVRHARPGSASLRMARPTVVEMYCLSNSTGSVCMMS